MATEKNKKTANKSTKTKKTTVSKTKTAKKKTAPKKKKAVEKTKYLFDDESYKALRNSGETGVEYDYFGENNNNNETTSKHHHHHSAVIDKTKKIIIASIAGVVVLLCVFLLVFNSNRYKLSALDVNNDGINTSIKLPYGWKLNEDGNVYGNDKPVAKLKMSISVMAVSEDTFNSYISKMEVYYDLEDVSTNKATIYTVDNIYNGEEDNEIDYYFVYKDGVLYEIAFKNISQNKAISIIGTIK